MNNFDFGYSWPWTHGHLIPALLFALLCAAAIRFAWRRWLALLCGFLSLWAFAGFWIMQHEFKMDSVYPPPTKAFLAQAAGPSPKILDAGAGSGRATVGLLQAFPNATVTALDIFSNNYGMPDNTEARLRANVRAAGAEPRLIVQKGDIREMPLQDASFDGVTSTYLIDHLNRDGILRSYREIHRVLKPGGEFLLVVINRDMWLRIAYPFLHGHYFGSAPQRDRWRRGLTEAGFVIMEEGTPPGTLYILGKKPLLQQPPKDGENKNDSR